VGDGGAGGGGGVDFADPDAGVCARTNEQRELKRMSIDREKKRAIFIKASKEG
jgi:hypothetical protein